MYNKTDIVQLIRLYGSQKVPIVSIRNARELGGYIAEDNRTIKRGKLLRTGSLAKASAEDIVFLTSKYNLTLAIDLRSPVEVTKNPAPVMNGVRTVHIPLIEQTEMRRLMCESCGGSEQFFGEDDPFSQITDAVKLVQSGFYPQLYRWYVESPDAQKSLKRVLREIEKHDDGAILLFCQEGKDRTGVVVAVLLAALGVNYETILADYELTNLF